MKVRKCGDLRIAIVLLLLLFSSEVMACFVQPEGLIEEHESDFIKMLGLGVGLFSIALLARFKSNKKRFWVPVASSLAIGSVPFFTYMRLLEGVVGFAGACGRPELLTAGKVLIGGMSVIVVYEFLHVWTVKRRQPKEK